MKRFVARTLFCSGISVFLCLACNKNNNPTELLTAFFAKGADISWLTEMEQAGKRFYDSMGRQQDLLTILADYEINSIRLRVWVNPADGWNGIEDLIVKARRAQAAGMELMIDFHYSDSWADPGKQFKPITWTGTDFSQLKDSLKAHTVKVLNALKANNITPTWIQIGNETNDGMLWEDGRASVNMKNFATLLQAGCDAARQVFPTAKMIVHISNGWDNNLFRWMFDGLKSYNVDYDVIGMSLYPTKENWQQLSAQCLFNMNDMVSRYDKDVMITEIGMPWDEPDVSQSFIREIIAKTKSVKQERGLGVFYWEPQSYNWKGYTLGCFDMNGAPTSALNGFR